MFPVVKAIPSLRHGQWTQSHRASLLPDPRQSRLWRAAGRGPPTLSPTPGADLPSPEANAQTLGADLLSPEANAQTLAPPQARTCPHRK